MHKNFFLSFAIIILILLLLCAVFSGVKVEKIDCDKKVKFHSSVLDEERTILIHLPKDYALSEKKYPILYVLDAEFFFQQAFLLGCS